MKDGFIKTAAAVINTEIADVIQNEEQIKIVIDEADKEKINLLVLPELCITGYTCSDLFFSDRLKKSSLESLIRLKKYTKGKYPVTIVGLPIIHTGKLYNAAAVLHDGKILGLVPKLNIPNYGEFYEKRHFMSGISLNADSTIRIDGEDIPFTSKQIFSCEEMAEFTFGIEICEDLWAVSPPSESLALSGASIIANLSASDETIGKDDYRRTLVSSTSARLLSGYIYASAGTDESTQDMVYSGHCIIAENGIILNENKPFENKKITVSEIDVSRLASEREKNTSFTPCNEKITRVYFRQKMKETSLTRFYARNPFVPDSKSDLNKRAGAILDIQSYGLRKRIKHTDASCVVLGISGGLDSTLALIVSVKAMDLLNRPHSDIIAVTMPCFGTTKRTKNNAVKLCEEYGVTLKEIDITKAVKQHFTDIGQDENNFDVTFENSQARERTQVIMDIANKNGGFVIGTGDLSELALGWATYNGDHMSMYAVNSSVPKTLVRYIVRYEASKSSKALADILYDILDTPVSPELLPVDGDGNMTQKTEDLVGPYELHDFFLYHTLRFGSAPSKIFRLARYVYSDAYDDKTILYWLRTFTRRFFNQQFKRSCMPDGVKVGSVTLSPRGDWRMPSDASSRIWLDEISKLEKEYLS